jgi:hypothetical protein
MECMQGTAALGGLGERGSLPKANAAVASNGTGQITGHWSRLPRLRVPRIG